MKQSKLNKQKVMYIALLAIVVVAIVAAITVALVVGLNGNNSPVIDPPISQGPGDEDKDKDKIPDEELPPPVDGEVELTYSMPLESYTPGQEFVIDKMVLSNTLGWYTTHNGTDFLAPSGTSVMAVYDGTVTSAGLHQKHGYYVEIEQENGIVAIYKSLSYDILVETGANIKAGTVIGKVGTSMSSEQNDGPHLHLEMTLNGTLIDPMSELDSGDK